MIEKRFDEWNELKKKLHSHGKTSIFYEREIWWYAVGENIGTEVNGKGPRFSRKLVPIVFVVYMAKWAKYQEKSLKRYVLEPRDYCLSNNFPPSHC